MTWIGLKVTKYHRHLSQVLDDDDDALEDEEEDVNLYVPDTGYGSDDYLSD